jgi:hypothetical protein
MKRVVIGVHLLRDDIEPVAEAIPVGDLFLSAVAVADDQPLGDRALLVQIAGVRAKLLETATFIAIRYGFAATSDVEAFAKCAAHLPRWTKLLAEHRDAVEMTLKTGVTTPRPRPDRKDFASGGAYLRALHAATQGAAADERLVEAADRLLGPLANRRHWTHRDEKSMELTLLVPRSRLDDFRKAAESLQAACGAIPFLISGPWPLEVFADADLE